MELFIWKGEPNWGVPAMDVKSLQMLAYIKFSGAPVTVKKVPNPFCSPSGKLPAFVCTDGILSDFNQVTTFLRNKNYSCDFELSAKQCADTIAYQNFVTEKLHPALMYLWWVEPTSYYEVIHKWFFKNIPLPFKFWYPGQFHQESTELITTKFNLDKEPQVVETELHKYAQECLTLLTNRLDDQDYFFGRSPSSLDAFIFPYLLLLLKVDLKVATLQNHVKASPNLLRYVAKIMQRYFSDESSTSHHNKSPTTEDVPNKGRNFVVSALVAVSAMFGYAVAAGLVQVDMGDSNLQHNYDFTDPDHE